MQILANALPGFRDLRPPLIAGYLWLLFGWLLSSPNIHKRPTSSLGAALYDLGQNIGRIWIAIGIGVAAYFAGAVSQVRSEGLQHYVHRLASMWGGWKLVRSVVRPERWDPSEIIVPLHRRAISVLESVGLPTAKDLIQETIRRAQAAAEGAAREPDRPATLLVGGQPQLFAEVDRLRAESELRIAAVPPLITLAILAATDDSFLWLLAVPVVLTLFVQGLQKRSDSRNLIIDAISVGRVPSSSITRFREWVDTLPDRLTNRELPPGTPTRDSPSSR